MMKLS